MVTLHLNLHRRFFDQIYSGEKLEEYRDISKFWATQFLMKYYVAVGNQKSNYIWAYMELAMGDYTLSNWYSFAGNLPAFKKFDTITFSNGYAKDRRQFVIEFKGFHLGQGNVAWGAVYKEDYFILKLGKILSTKNINN